MAKLSNIIEQIPLDTINQNDKRFSFSLTLKSLGLWPDKFHKVCKKDILITAPLLVIASGNNIYLLDGYKRVATARKLGIKRLPAICIKELSMPELALQLLFNHVKLLSTPATKALFLAHLLKDVGLEESFIIQEIMPELDLGPNKTLLKKYLKISQLPDKVLTFCHQKDISFKKTLQFTTYKRELLNWLFDQEERLNLTVSICQELVESINDILKRDGISLSEFLKKYGLVEILEKDLPPSQRTARFRAIIKKLRNPRWSQINSQMQNLKNMYFGKGPFEITWDQSLENRRLTLKAEIKSIEDLQQLRQILLSSDKIHQGIKELLNFL